MDHRVQVHPGNLPARDDFESNRKEADSHKLRNVEEAELGSPALSDENEDSEDVITIYLGPEDEEPGLVIRDVCSLSGSGNNFGDDMEEESDGRTRGTASAGRPLYPDTDSADNSMQVESCLSDQSSTIEAQESGVAASVRTHNSGVDDLVSPLIKISLLSETVTSQTRSKRKESYFQAEGGQEAQNDATSQPKTKRKRIQEVTSSSTEECCLMDQVSWSPSANIPLHLSTGNAVSCDSVTSVVYTTIGKPVIVPLELGVTQPFPSISHTFPSTYSVQGESIPSAPRTSMSNCSHVNVEPDGNVTLTVRDKNLAMLLDHIPESFSQIISLPDGSVQNVSIDIDQSVQSQKIVPNVNPTKSFQEGTSCVVAPNSSFPVSFENVIQCQGSVQRMGTTAHQTTPTLKPESISTYQSVQSNVVSVECSVASTQPLTDNTKFALYSDQTSAQSLSSGLSLLTSNSRPTDPQVTRTPVVLSSTQQPTSASVVASPSVLLQEITTVSTVLCNTVPTTSQKRPICTVPRLPSVGACDNLATSEAALNPTQAAPNLASEIIEKIPSGSRQGQDVRLDKANSEAKMCAGDMALLIQGENLVPSLPPRQPPGRAGCNSNVYRCVECSSMYCTLVGYVSHVKRISMVIRYACDVCKAFEVFFNKCTFLAHLRKHAVRSSREQVQRFTVLSFPKELLYPIGVQFMDPMNVSRSEPVSCSECMELFPNASELATHFGAEVVDYGFEHSCSRCRMELPTACALKAHERLHDDQTNNICTRKPYVCPECGLVFCNQLSLCQHVFATCLHFNRRLIWHCPFCKDFFPSLQTLEDHMFFVHPSKKEFICGLCKHTYHSWKFFMEHISKLHKDVKQIPFEDVAPCTSSSIESDVEQGRNHARKHMYSKKPGGFACLFCTDFMHVTHHELLVHLSQVHGGYRYTCCVCQSGFLTLALLRTHGQSAHSGNVNEKSEIRCGMCTTVLNRDSVLPHIMWHVIQKCGKGDVSADSVTLPVNKYTMEILSTSDENSENLFCHYCGYVASSHLLLQRHLLNSYHRMYNKFHLCPFCQSFDFVGEELFNRHIMMCSVNGFAHSASTDRKKGDQEQTTSLTGQTTQGTCGESVSSSIPGLMVEKPGERTTCSYTAGREANRNSTGSNSLRPKTVIIFNKNGNVIGVHNTTSISGSPKHATITSKEGQPAKMDVSGTVSRSVLPKQLKTQVSSTVTQGNSVTQSVLRKGLLERAAPLQTVSVPHGTEGQNSSHSRQSASSDSTVILEEDLPAECIEELTSEHMDIGDPDPEPEMVYYPCHLCGLTYSSAKELSIHYNNIHRVEKTVKACPLCAQRGLEKVLTKKNLKKHLTRSHRITLHRAEAMTSDSISGLNRASSSQEAEASSAPGSSNCSTISEIPDSATLAMQEPVPVKQLRVAGGDQQEYVCAKCDFSSPSREEFYSHVRVHAVDNSVQCLDCGVCYATLTSLKSHLRVVHKVNQPDAYIAEHSIKLPELSADILSLMNKMSQKNKLPPHGEPEVVIRSRVFHKHLHKSKRLHKSTSFSQDRVKKRPATEMRDNNMSLTCKVCHINFEKENDLRIHIKRHGMAFICSRRAFPRLSGGKKCPDTNESAEKVSSENHQPTSPTHCTTKEM